MMQFNNGSIIVKREDFHVTLVVIHFEGTIMAYLIFELIGLNLEKY